MILAAGTTVPYGNALSGASIVGGIIVGVAILAITGGFAYLFKQNQARNTENENKNLARDGAMSQLLNTTNAIQISLEGQEPTKLNPNPPPGLIEVLKGKNGDDGLVHVVEQVSSKLDQHIEECRILALGHVPDDKDPEHAHPAN